METIIFVLNLISELIWNILPNDLRNVCDFALFNPTKVVITMKTTFIPALMPPDFQSNLYRLTLIMLPKLFKALALSDVVILTSLSLSYHYIAIIILLEL